MTELAMLLLLLAVTFWVAGFDIIYSLLDLDFDKKNGLYSVPSFFGVKNALLLSFASHILMIGFLAGLMLAAGLGVIFKAGLLIISLLILYEHSLVKVENFTKVQMAFFNVNAAVSLSILVFTVADVLV
ncbi:MAG TPA: UbiA family prenyltransferase, partial [Candidatus Methanoperedens sp.]